VARLSVLLGGTLIGAEAFLRGSPAAAPGTWAEFTPGEIALLDEVGDTIIPATDTPGAKAVGIGAFMVRIVRDCYNPAQQATFRAGLGELENTAKSSYGAAFLACRAEQRVALLNTLDAAQKQWHLDKRRDEPEHYFRMFKQLTILGYFTSEVGATQALRYVESPGSFDGNYPQHPGDRDWFRPAGSGI
jgi:hypothetical protein